VWREGKLWEIGGRWKGGRGCLTIGSPTSTSVGRRGPRCVRFFVPFVHVVVHISQQTLEDHRSSQCYPPTRSKRADFCWARCCWRAKGASWMTECLEIGSGLSPLSIQHLPRQQPLRRRRRPLRSVFNEWKRIPHSTVGSAFTTWKDSVNISRTGRAARAAKTAAAKKKRKEFTQKVLPTGINHTGMILIVRTIKFWRGLSLTNGENFYTT
jgi:hypothetical protein